MNDDIKMTVVFVCVGVLILLLISFVVGFRIGFVAGLNYVEPEVITIPNLP